MHCPTSRVALQGGMKKQIQEQIDSAVEQLHALEIEKAKLDTRLETLREMLDLAPDDDTPKRTTRRRSLSPQWQGVLYFMQEDHPDGASYDDIHQITERVGIDMKKANLRGHMGNYKASGYVKAVSPGTFVLTPDGKKQATKPEVEKPAAKATGSQETGADTGRGDGYPPDNPSGSIPDASTDTSSSDYGGYSGYTAPPNMDDEIPF